MDVEYADKMVIFSCFEYEKLKNKKIFVIMKMLKKILSVFLIKRTMDGEIQKYTFFYSVERKDHKELFEKIYNCCTFEKSMLSLKKRFTINFYTLFMGILNLKFLCNIKSILNSVYVNRKLSFIANIYICINTYFEYLQQKDFLRNIKKLDDSKMKCFVVLADALSFEQTAVCYFNTKNVKTVTAQHATFFWNERVNNIQKLNYYKVPSQYILTWGENTNKLFNKLNLGKKLIICGNPIVKRQIIDSEDYIAICGDAIENLKQNRSMIEIVEKFAAKNAMYLLVRLHPNDSESNYSVDNTITQFKKDIDKARFIIGHTSTMICRYLAEGKKVFRYRSDVIFDIIPDTIEFSTENELEELVKKSDKIDFKSMAEQNIKYCGKESENFYRQAFQYIYEQ